VQLFPIRRRAILWIADLYIYIQSYWDRGYIKDKMCFSDDSDPVFTGISLPDGFTLLDGEMSNPDSFSAWIQVHDTELLGHPSVFLRKCITSKEG
jgi:hypothetical protein